MARVVYKPLENGDPIDTIFGGIKFKASVPVEVPADVTMLILERVEKINEDGLPRATSVEKKVPLVDVLKTNPYFEVEGQAATKPKRGRPALPKTPEEYRSHAQAWFAAAGSPDELEERWQSESALRERIGMPDDGDDVRFLQPFYQARHHELKKAVA